MIAFLVSAVAAASQGAPAAAPRSVPAIAPSGANAAVVAHIRQLEQDWGQAFVKRDYAFLERIVAPEYRVATVAADGRVALTYRDEWMLNTRNFRVDAFAAEVVDVTTAGDTAVALVHGLWTVQRSPDRPAESIRFFVTDTWTRRNGRWQVIHRYSQRLPQAPWPPPRQGAAAGKPPAKP